MAHISFFFFSWAKIAIMLKHSALPVRARPHTICYTRICIYIYIIL